MTAKEYPEYVVGQASVYRLNTHELTVEFSYSRQFKAEYLKCLEIGQHVRVPLYTTTPPSVDSITNEIIGNLYEMVMELTEPNNSSEELKAKYRASVVNLFEVNDELQKR